jgi:hypothetical protein
MTTPTPQNDELVELLRNLSGSGVIAYVWFLIMAVWGGTASYITRIKKNKVAFSVMELIGEWTVSGFVGFATALICQHAGFDFAFTAVGAGIAGHMGGRAAGLLENWFLTRAQLRADHDKEGDRNV